MPIVCEQVTPGPGCTEGCPLLLWHQTDALVALESADGVICAACRDHAALVRAAQRWLQPQRPRSGRRHHGETRLFEPCRWSEAIESLAHWMRSLKESNGNLLWFERPGSALLNAIPRLISAFMPATTLVRGVDGSALVASFGATDSWQGDWSDEAAPDLIVAWGASARVPERPDLLAQVVIDSCPSAATRLAPVHLQHSPGCEAQLALLIEQRLLGAIGSDTESLGVDAAKLAEVIARLRAARRPLFIVGAELGRSPALPTIWNTLARIVERCAGRCVTPAGPLELFDRLELPVGARFVRQTCDLFRQGIEAIDPRRTVVVIDLVEPRLWPALGAQVESFLKSARAVVQFAYCADTTTRFADLVIPTSSPWERADSNARRGVPGRFDADATLQLPRDVVPELAVWRRVARICQWPERWFPRDSKELIGRLGAAAPEVGRVEPISIPTVRDAAEGPNSTPELFRAYRLWLVPEAGSQVRSLAAGSAPAVVRLNPTDAHDRRIDDGTPVVVHNARGSLPAVARVDRDLAPGTAVVRAFSATQARLAQLATPTPSGFPGPAWPATLGEVSLP